MGAAAVGRLRHGGLHAVRVRQPDAPAAQVRSLEPWNALVERSIPTERGGSGGRRKARIQHEWVTEVAAEGFLRRQPARVERGPIAAAQDGLLVQTIDGADARRNPVLRSR